MASVIEERIHDAWGSGHVVSLSQTSAPLPDGGARVTTTQVEEFPAGEVPEILLNAGRPWLTRAELVLAHRKRVDETGQGGSK